MPATSPSPSKRPSMAERSSSTLSLSSSGRPANPNAGKGHRVHVVNKHQRNLSHGKGLNKLGRVSSTANVVGEGKSHQRKKSGPVTPTESPKTPVGPSNLKRNSSHAAIPKNTSHGNLRKNHSASALAAKRNRSHGALMKLNAAPQKQKETEQKQGFFALGDQSSEEEEEGEWEDSATQSPEMSRNQSKTSTPLRPRTPNGDFQKPANDEKDKARKVSDPPEPAISTTNTKSAPNLRQALTDNLPPDPALLHNKSRATRAPPAMSTVSAQVAPSNVLRTDSVKSLVGSQKNGTALSLGGSTPVIGTASSGSGGVSHFLQASSLATSAKTFETGSDDDSASGFMANYKPQIADSPERSRSLLNKMQLGAAPSRTNQKMELQRRETMRAGSAAAGTQGPGAVGLGGGSTVSLHSRSGSKAGVRNRSIAGEMKALKQDYETTVKQLTVTRRFRNPVLESLYRLQESDTIPSDNSPRTQTSAQNKSRPQSRRGPSTVNTPKQAMARSPEDKKNVPPQDARAANHQRHSRVQFQLSRQASHDDIGLTTSQGSPGDFEDEPDGVSSEEALVRRIWEARVVFESEGVQTAA